MNIDVKQLKVIFKCVVLKRAPHWNSCILNNHIEFSVLSLQVFDDFLGYGSNCIVVGHVHPYDGYMGGPIAFFFDSLQLGLIPCWYDDVSPKAIEFVCEILSEAGGGAGDPDSFAEIVGSALSPFVGFVEGDEYVEDDNSFDDHEG